VATEDDLESALDKAARIVPMTAVAGSLPSGDSWAFEVKWDGVRVIAAVGGGRVRARGRSGKDVTRTYPELASLADALGSTTAVLDGEVVAFGPDGRPDFALLAHRMHVTDPAVARLLARATPVRYLAFDLLHLDGRPTLEATYDDRRDLLEALPGLTVPESFRGAGVEGAAVFTAATAAGLEGVVAKRRSSPYQPGRRSPDWVKVKNTRRQSVVVGGWEPGLGKRADRIGALLVGVALPAAAAGLSGGGDAGPPGGDSGDAATVRFRYAGQVGTGFSDATLDLLAELLAPLRRERPPFPDVPPEYARNAVWVEPLLVAEVEYSVWTPDGRLRHPSFKGLRDDVDPAQTIRPG
jgi:bifunctional non-homologous end joining protein LigD